VRVDENVERVSLTTRCEGVQRLGVFTDVMMNVQKTRHGWLEFCKRTCSNRTQVTHATNFNQNR
jgi:hypothetical protein